MVSDKSKQKTITIIGLGASTGGSGKVSSMIANHYAEMGYQVNYIALVYQSVDYYVDERVNYIYFNPDKKKRSPSWEKNLFVYRFLRKNKSDYVISFLTNPVFFSSIFIDSHFIFSLRNDPNSVNTNTIDRIIRNFEYSRADCVVFQTPGAQKYFSNSIQRHSIIIGNPINSTLPYWKDYEHEKSIITTCRLDKQKNIPMLLKAFKLFHDKHKDYSLKICGIGPLKGEMEELVKQLNLVDAVQFLGFRNDVAQLVAQSSIFALTSDFEGLSNSMLEALAIGIPAVCTDCAPGGAALYISDHHNGILIPVNDHIALCNAWEEIIGDKSLENDMSYNAVNIRKVLNQETILKEWDKVLESCSY